MDVDEDFVEGVTDEDNDGSASNSEEDAEGEDDEENEDDAPNPEETYAEKEIEGDFDGAVNSGGGGTVNLGWRRNGRLSDTDQGVGMQSLVTADKLVREAENSKFISA
ncbi:uncharacterized protein LACBIDRAFT_331300 [Laccaria bicolor S238N-H82]|uniref:Predicted protein n=1 Tax=Laccaria bicolor (strain S238N-H82 / ATCC MYA-4686) TaxID=486041 RepID=B0DP25_LACBS|nr:uncharacterized protein LACBIDRAFT_331300 [Laccaria bicolor S238N-H82]EDR03537.1 predicted protein [Laccaria bicolor S238N-H82]|eukprot:XP_001885685.1 predicted protein [Laccaria bicolor S238N-H82]